MARLTERHRCGLRPLLHNQGQRCNLCRRAVSSDKLPSRLWRPLSSCRTARCSEPWLTRSSEFWVLREQELLGVQELWAARFSEHWAMCVHESHSTE